MTPAVYCEECQGYRAKTSVDKLPASLSEQTDVLLPLVNDALDHLESEHGISRLTSLLGAMTAISAIAKAERSHQKIELLGEPKIMGMISIYRDTPTEGFETAKVVQARPPLIR